MDQRAYFNRRQSVQETFLKLHSELDVEEDEAYESLK